MISVIIPVYNTGSYLQQCVRSVLDQTWRDLEVVLVDDGSERPTAELCDALAREDSRVVVVHKPNGGVSSARNVGLDRAHGDIICFVDSDDTIVPRMLETLVSALDTYHAQIAMCDAVTIRPGHPDEPDTIPDFDCSCVIETRALSPATLTRLAGSACRCAYKRTDTLASPQVRFPEGLKFSEDRIFNIMAMSQASRIAYIKEPFYNRLIRPGSACFRYYPDMTEQIARMRDVIIPTVIHCWGDEYVRAYEDQVRAHILTAVTNFTAFGIGANLSYRLSKLKTLCDNPSIRACLQGADTRDIRSRAILARNYPLLYIMGNLTNLYHKICKRGQYRV